MPHSMTHHEQDMIGAHPRPSTMDREALGACIQACLVCAATCTSCADACSAESDPKMLVRCIRLNNDCADLCVATARIVGRQAEPDAAVIRAALDACIAACAACATECERHAPHMEHCRICADACRACEDACRRLTTAKAKA